MADVQRTGLALRDPLPWHDFAQAVRTAEEAGYEALFAPEIAGREAFSTLAGVAGATERIGLGTGVVALPARRLSTTAMAAATVQELSGGRLVLGLGADRPAGARWTAFAVVSWGCARRCPIVPWRKQMGSG